MYQSNHTHVMLDLETLDTETSAVITAIGAVAFDPYTQEMGETIYFELVDDIAEQQKRGRTISGDTVRWWMEQGQAAQQLFAKDPPVRFPHCRVPTREALEQFALFTARCGGKFDVEMWGNGADFDNILLGSMYDDFGVLKPWSYSRNRCFRTMKATNKDVQRPTHAGVHHHALDDAITQAEHLQAIFRSLKA